VVNLPSVVTVESTVGLVKDEDVEFKGF